MKKIFISIFATFYLGLSCGFAFNVHFCMGKISSVDFFKNSEKNCGKCGMKHMKDCCNSKVIVAKITNSQQPAYSELDVKSPVIATINHAHYSFVKPVAQIVRPTFNSTPPQKSSGAFLCILNSIFIL
jgi:hypothetical protein